MIFIERKRKGKWLKYSSLWKIFFLLGIFWITIPPRGVSGITEFGFVISYKNLIFTRNLFLCLHTTINFYLSFSILSPFMPCNIFNFSGRQRMRLLFLSLQAVCGYYIDKTLCLQTVTFLKSVSLNTTAKEVSFDLSYKSFWMSVEILERNLPNLCLMFWVCLDISLFIRSRVIASGVVAEGPKFDMNVGSYVMGGWNVL